MAAIINCSNYKLQIQVFLHMFDFKLDKVFFIR